MNGPGGALIGILNRSLVRAHFFIHFVPKKMQFITSRIKGAFLESNKSLEELLEKRPYLLRIETTTLCNARCRFCVYLKSERKKEEMPLELYEKIIREYSEMGGGVIDLSPITGDFFLNSKCLERIEIARKYPNIGAIKVTTNAIAMDRIKDNWDSFIKQTDCVQFSVGGLDKDSYREMYGVDKYERVRQNIIEFAMLKNRIKPRYSLTMFLRVKKKFLKLIRDPDYKMYKNLGIKIVIDNVYGNWSGMVSEKDLPHGVIFKKNAPIHEKANPCFVFYLGLNVTVSGLAVACGCIESENTALEIGDCKRQSLKDIWNNEKYKKLKSSFAAGNMPQVCRNCTFYEDGIKFSLTPQMLNFEEGRYYA